MTHRWQGRAEAMHPGLSASSSSPMDVETTLEDKESERVKEVEERKEKKQKIDQWRREGERCKVVMRTQESTRVPQQLSFSGPSLTTLGAVFS